MRSSGLRCTWAVLAALLLMPGCDSKSPSTASGSSTAERAEPVTSRPVHDGKRPMMIEFSRDYCTPCQVMKPWVEELAAEHQTIDVLTLNVDRKRFEHFGSFFQVTAVPSLIFVDADGRILKRSEGLASKAKMNAALQELGWAP